MVTIDKIVQNVGKFNGKVTENSTNYEKAKANVELLKDDKSMMKLEETLKKNTGYDDFNLPWKPDDYNISLGGVTFNVRSETTTKRPQYKSAVEQMENYLGGINLLLSENRVITGVAKENDLWCINIDNLLENYEVILAGVKYPGIKQTIKYDAADVSTPKELDVSEESDGRLTTENFREYVMKDSLFDISKKYVKAYEKELGSQEKVGDVIPLTTKKGYQEKPIKSEGVDWGYVAKTLVNNDPKAPGELNVLVNPDISFEDTQEKMPQYTLFIREPFGEKKLYVGIRSVYDRIQQLKNDRTIVREGAVYTPKAIV
ncbi:MAG: hypothetical protein ACP5NW_02935 [Candidatus Woesearchaeota archaeon]